MEVKFSKSLADIHEHANRDLVVPEAYPKEVAGLVSSLKLTLNGMQAQMSLIIAHVLSFHSTLEELITAVDAVRQQSEIFLKTDVSQYLDLKQMYSAKTNQ